MAFEGFNAMGTLMASSEAQVQRLDRITSMMELHNQRIELQQQELRQLIFNMKESADLRAKRIYEALEAIQPHLQPDDPAPISTGSDEDEAIVDSSLHSTTPQLAGASISVSDGLVGGSALSETETGMGGFSFVRSEPLGTDFYQTKTVVVGPILIDSGSRASESRASSTEIGDDKAAEDESILLEVEVTKSDETTSSGLRELQEKFSRPVARSKSSLNGSRVGFSAKFSQIETVCFSTAEREALGWQLGKTCGVVDPSQCPRTDHFLAREKPPPWPPPRIWRSDEESEKLSLTEELEKLTPTRKIIRGEWIQLAVDAMEFDVMMRTTTRFVEEPLDGDKPPPWPPPTSYDLQRQGPPRTTRNSTWGFGIWSRGHRRDRDLVATVVCSSASAQEY